jgi:hypothetical protein
MADAEAVARLSLDNSPYKQGLAEANAAMDKFSASISGQMKHLGGVIAGAFAFDKLISGFERSISQGAKIGELASRFGVSAEALQKIGNAANQSGASLEDVASAMNKLAKNAGSAIGGNEKLQQTFQEIGVSVDDLAKMTPEDLFMKLSRAVHDGSLGSRDFAVAMELAGKNAGVLMETLRGGPEEIDRISGSMGVFSDDTVKSLKDAEDAMKRFDHMVMIAFGNIASYAVPALETFEKVAERLGFLMASAGAFFSGDVEASKLIDRAADEAWKAKKKEGAGPRVTGAGSGMADGVDSENVSRRSSKDSESSGIGAAYKIAAKFENDQIDYQRKEADRIAKLQEDRAAQKEADQQAYYRKQGKEQSDYSARQDKQTALYSKTSAEYMDAYMAKNAVENRIAGESLSASREGQLILNAAQKRQANQNRIDNYKFQQEQVQKYVDKMQTRGSGQSAEQFERYSNMTPDQARKAAREDLAKQQAAETNPSMRDKANTTLEGYLKNVDALLNQLTQYAHVT